ncbi:hypothetical protein [Ignicoccus hospitalis]|uniref:Uncharacterized protein n=1 Tax=Ignicoccus hospitalis (strain KIN4/I / DSM 18386 / JCM 14125) TaxID=453591 RepID=A8A9B4_IGNH4|nr:hypothetical protein [Ignicoccus hospitalis]ABU81516.1 hypothetical protein Igni_0333 [Ignicoccus hospitalis KIN4/I]HIH90451.1 hypothetical protein [Desulfurococcaceae archaeon]
MEEAFLLVVALSGFYRDAKLVNPMKFKALRTLVKYSKLVRSKCNKIFMKVQTQHIISTGFYRVVLKSFVYKANTEMIRKELEDSEVTVSIVMRRLAPEEAEEVKNVLESACKRR